MSPPDLLALLGALPELYARVERLEEDNRSLRAQLAALSEGQGDDGAEPVATWAGRTGRTLAAAHKLARREELAQAAGRPPRFQILRRGRAVLVKGAP